MACPMVQKVVLIFLDLSLLLTTVLFSVVSLPKKYDQANCEYNIEAWFIMAFINFYAFQVLMFFIQRKQKNVSRRFILWLATLLVYLPWVLYWNLYGNTILQSVDRESGSTCLYNGLFEMLALLFLIFNYIIAMMFLFLSCRVHAYILRYWKRVMPNAPNVGVYTFRKYDDWLEGFSFAIFLI